MNNENHSESQAAVVLKAARLSALDALGQLSDKEKEELKKWLQQDAGNRQWWQELMEEGKLSAMLKDIEQRNKLTAPELEKLLRKISEKDLTTIRGTKKTNVFRIITWAAASIVLFWGSYLALQNTQNSVSTATTSNQKIQPGKQGAVLTLADGSQVLLDTVKDGEIALQKGVRAKLVYGKLVYEGVGNEPVYNTMYTPRGRTFQLTLPDGTGVWLNAESSIRYPTVFTGDERVVETTGESYFEVVKDSRKPFIVNISNQSKVEVLGTHFNVNAYADEPSVKITLLEGLVSVSGRVEKVLLKPGQQAQVKNTISVVDSIDPDEVMAWKQGIFMFEKARIEEVMKTLSRWYDFDVRYEKGIPQTRFRGKIPRDTDISDVVKILQESGINCNINNRQITITP